MPDDWEPTPPTRRDDSKPRGADGTVEDQRDEDGRWDVTPNPEGSGAEDRPPQRSDARREDSTLEDIDRWMGPRGMAAVSWASILVALPIFLVPLLMRRDTFAIEHARAAAVAFGLLYGSIFLTTISCGILAPVILVAYVPMVIGAVRAFQGRLPGKWALGEVATRFFAYLEREFGWKTDPPDRLEE
jgi:hypothetical protein